MLLHGSKKPWGIIMEWSEEFVETKSRQMADVLDEFEPVKTLTSTQASMTNIIEVYVQPKVTVIALMIESTIGHLFIYTPQGFSYFYAPNRIIACNAVGVTTARLLTHKPDKKHTLF